MTAGDATLDDSSPYATVLSLGDDQRTIFSDDLVVVRKSGLARAVWEVSGQVLHDVTRDLDAIITPAGATLPGERPPKYSRTWQIRFADLHIPDEGEKPVVVISSNSYAQDVGYAFVVACRVTSNPARVRTYEVSLTTQTGKVVCSEVQTVLAQELRDRTTRGAGFVSAAEAAEILSKVRTLLALERLT